MGDGQEEGGRMGGGRNGGNGENGEAPPPLSLRGAQYPIPLSLRGAKRRGNPSSPSQHVQNPNAAKGNGLPRQCAHWRAMTEKPQRRPPTCHCEERSDVAIRSPFRNMYRIPTLSPPPVIARSEATWQSVLLFVACTESNAARGNGLPRQCAHWLAMTEKPKRRPHPCHFTDDAGMLPGPDCGSR